MYYVEGMIIFAEITESGPHTFTTVWVRNPYLPYDQVLQVLIEGEKYNTSHTGGYIHLKYEPLAVHTSHISKMYNAMEAHAINQHKCPYCDGESHSGGCE